MTFRRGAHTVQCSTFIRAPEPDEPHPPPHGLGQRIGKITWLSRVRGQGILASIDGMSRAFQCADGADEATALTVGQVVTYQAIVDGPMDGATRIDNAVVCLFESAPGSRVGRAADSG